MSELAERTMADDTTIYERGSKGATYLHVSHSPSGKYVRVTDEHDDTLLFPVEWSQGVSDALNLGGVDTEALQADNERLRVNRTVFEAMGADNSELACTVDRLTRELEQARYEIGDLKHSAEGLSQNAAEYKRELDLAAVSVAQLREARDEALASAKNSRLKNDDLLDRVVELEAQVEDAQADVDALSAQSIEHGVQAHESELRENAMQVLLASHWGYR